MTQLVVDLPDDLAQRAQAAGLLSSEAIESLLREKLRKQAGQELLAMMKKLANDGTPPMSEDEIQAEVDAVRTVRRAKKHS